MASVTRRAAQLYALPVEEQLVLLLALALVAHVRLALYVLPSRLSLRLVQRLAAVAPITAGSSRIPVMHLARAVEAVSRFVPQATCLTQAIAGRLLLWLYRYESKLCLGVVKPSDGEFCAHAWLERDGRVLIGGAQATGLTRFPSLASKTRRTPRVGTR